MPAPSLPSIPTPRRRFPGRLAWTLAAGSVVGLTSWLTAAGPGWPSLLLALGAAGAVWWAPARAVPMPPAPARHEPTDADLRDPNTGMFHRPAFLALAERDWALAGRHGGAVALLLIEVDRLRSMTDQAGPAVADVLLSGLGTQVLTSLRTADLLSRFDAAQLAVFLPHADPTGALDVAERIRSSVEHLVLPGLPKGAQFSASIGVAVMPPLHQPLSALVAAAQQALQTARQAGGNCVRTAPAGPAVAGAGTDPWVDGGTTRPGRNGGG